MGSKTQNGFFPSKIALRLKKVYYTNFLCVKTISDKVVPLNVNLALSEEPLFGARAVPSRNLTNTLWIAIWNLKLLAMFINWTNRRVWMHYTIAD